MEMNFEDAQFKRKYFKIAYILMQVLSFWGAASGNQL